MNRILLALAVTAAALACAAPATAAKKKSLYLSLGDSLAWSFTKLADGAGAKSANGYTELLAGKRKVRNLACPGEDTRTFIEGGHCGWVPEGNSQLDRAVRYLENKRGRVAFVTLSIGGNNFTPCARGGASSVDLDCVAKGMADLEADLPRIYRRLRKAAGRRVRIATATQYNPYLAFYLQGTDYHQLAGLTTVLARQVNKIIREAAKSRKARLRVADAFAAFEAGAPVPEAVETLCAHSFMCDPAPVGPDIHPTDSGYAAIAEAFRRALRLR